MLHSLETKWPRRTAEIPNLTAVGKANMHRRFRSNLGFSWQTLAQSAEEQADRKQRNLPWHVQESRATLQQ